MRAKKITISQNVAADGQSEGHLEKYRVASLLKYEGEGAFGVDKGMFFKIKLREFGK